MPAACASEIVRLESELFAARLAHSCAFHTNWDLCDEIYLHICQLEFRLACLRRRAAFQVVVG